MVARSRVGHRDLPAPRGGGPRHRPRTRTWCSSRTRRARATRTPRAAGGDVRAGHGVPAGAPLVLYTGTFEAYQGLDLLFAAMTRVLARRPTPAWCWWAATPDQIERARREAAAQAASAASTVFAGEQPAEEIPAVPRGGRRAGVAPEPRQEHAAQDLPVPPERQADRGDQPADAHAGARRDGGVTGRPDAGGVRRRHPPGDRATATRAAALSQAALHARRHALHLRGVRAKRTRRGARGRSAGAEQAEAPAP